MTRRVLLATRTFVPEVNAAAFRLGALAEALADREADVEVVTSIPPRRLRDIPPPAPARGRIRLRRWPVLRDRGGNVRGYVQYASYDVPLVLRLLFRPCDVIVSEAPPTTGIVAAAVARLRRKPLVYYAADIWSDGVAAVGSPGIIVSTMRILERTVLRSAAVVLSVSEGVTQRLHALGTDPRRIEGVGHGVDTDVFRPDGPVAVATEPYFVYTGTMSEVHSPQVFIEALALIAADEPAVRLRFFGQGVHEQELKELSEQLVPGRVEFGGVVPPEDAAGWIRGSVAALVSQKPGIGYDYAHPTKAYAAAACGTPILFTGGRVFGSLVAEAGIGEAVEFTPEAVAEAMRRLLAQAADGITERLRAARATWARDNVSLSAVGRRAADAVLGSR